MQRAAALAFAMVMAAALASESNAACGCSVSQQQMLPVSSSMTTSANSSSSEPDSAGNSSTSSSSTAAPRTTGEQPIVATRIDDMLIPLEDLQERPSSAAAAAADSVQAASAAIAPGDFMTCRKLWPGGRLYFRFATDYPAAYKSLVRQALVVLSAKTGNNVTFWEADYYTSIAHVTVINGDGCYSYVGKVYSYSSQDLSLAVPGCMLESIVQHEFMHALGFIHEHTRIDRDSYVQIMWNYIQTDACNNFIKFTYQIPSDFPGYDLTSVMHYTSDAFTCLTNYTTFTIKYNGKTVTQRTNLSSTDVDKLRYVYSERNLLYCSSSTSSSTSSSSRSSSSRLAVTLCCILIVPAAGFWIQLVTWLK